jgi:tRNA A37 methylthiotransferase MiaB
MGEQISPELKSLRSDLLISDAEEYRREYGERFIGQTEQVLFEETTVENGETYLYGHTGRYVKVGVPLPEAQEKGYQENEIYEVRIGKILSK